MWRRRRIALQKGGGDGYESKALKVQLPIVAVPQTPLGGGKVAHKEEEKEMDGWAQGRWCSRVGR